MLIKIPWSFRVQVKSSLVNWPPWSVLKISGRPYRESASLSRKASASCCTPTTGVASKLFQAVGVALPPNVQELPLPASQSLALPRGQHRGRGAKTASCFRKALNLCIFLPIGV